MCELNYQNFFKNDGFYISRDYFVELNQNFSKDDIKTEIIKAIREKDIKMPFIKPSLENMKSDFLKLKKENTNHYLQEGKWHTRYDYRWDKIDQYIEGANAGLISSNYFHMDSRLKCDSINAPSPVRVWNSDKFLFTLLNYFWSALVSGDITNDTFRSAISMRKYIAAQYKPSIAKYVYNTYSNNGSVLDFSSGWGDRLAGFYTSNAQKYIGIDPNASLFDGYNEQIKAYSKMTDGKEARMINDVAENVELKDEFDLIFTSPPYFNIERYTQLGNQSFKKHKKLDRWLNDFLFKTVGKFWNNLKDNGKLIINISDVYSNHTINKICDPLNDYISTLPNSNYVGAIGMRMAKRPNTQAIKDGIFCEPLWIWEKTGINKYTKDWLV